MTEKVKARLRYNHEAGSRDNGASLEIDCPTEEEVARLCKEISVLCVKIDSLVESHKTPFRWLLAAMILIALSNSKLAEIFINFIAK